MTTDLVLRLAAGVDIPIPELQLVLRQPVIKDIAFMGETNFFTAIHYICLDKQSFTDQQEQVKDLSNFQILMQVLAQPEAQEQKKHIQTLFMILFPSKKFMITPNGFILMEGEQVITIDDSNFEILREILIEVLCIHSLFQGDNVIYKPANEAAQKIVDKIMAGRKKAAAQKSTKSSSVFTRYISILTVGMGSMSLNDCVNLTMFQIFDLMNRYELYFAWDIDLRCRLAGGDPKKEVENWMKDAY